MSGIQMPSLNVICGCVYYRKYREVSVSSLPYLSRDYIMYAKLNKTKLRFLSNAIYLAALFPEVASCIRFKRLPIQQFSSGQSSNAPKEEKLKKKRFLLNTHQNNDSENNNTGCLYFKFMRERLSSS